MEIAVTVMKVLMYVMIYLGVVLVIAKVCGFNRLGDGE